jgi:predicted MFS family arabinose efflux permease
MRRHFSVLAVLGLSQTIAWGAVGVLPVLARPMAASLAVPMPWVFLGTSVMFVAMALAAPLAARAFRRFTTRRVMAAGAVLIGLGLWAMSLVDGLWSFLAVWALIGVAGAMVLTTAAYVWLSGYAEADARWLIGTLMLMTGLAGSLFWPVTAVLEHELGWRGAVLVFGGVMLLVGPLIRYGLPDIAAPVVEPVPPGRTRRDGVFGLMVAAIALNSFVTFGIEVVGIELLRAMGATLSGAVAVAVLLGVFKVGGRVIDLIGGRRWDGLSTGLVAGTMIPLGLVAIWAGGPGLLGVGGYLVLFGIGSGAFAVARATLPLTFYAKADYAAAMSVIALPMNLINALAPPALAALMAGIGAKGVLAVLGTMSLLALGALVLLARRRPQAGA